MEIQFGSIDESGCHVAVGCDYDACRLYVDVAYMLLKRKQFETLLESRPVFFGLIDFSPQGGRNWEIFELYGSLM